MKFTARELMYLGAIAAGTLAIGVALGTGLTAATGIPMVGGLLNGLITAAILSIGAKGVPKFGTGIILWFVMSTLAVPTLTMGPPGLYKIAVGLISGLVWDLCFLIFGRKTWGYLLSGSVMMLTVMFGVVGASVLLGLPAKDQLLKALAFILPLNFILGLIGTYLGLKIFDRRVVRIGYVRRMLSESNGLGTPPASAS
ncbi:MAG TPA: hypothetical protein VN493_18235 [Thermoanaerobaculia bacterium]|nr:hypothetical protein [Thermoanaerobaculia bacterium]